MNNNIINNKISENCLLIVFYHFILSSVHFELDWKNCIHPLVIKVDRHYVSIQLYIL